MQDIGTTGKKTFTQLAEESGRSVDDIKADVKALAAEYQKNGDNIPLSYKKAYDKMGLYSEAAEKKMKQSSEDAKEEMKDDADEISDSHKKNSEKSAQHWKTAFSGIGKVVSTGVKVFGAAAGVAAAGVTALGTAAINNYADFEQLKGGIETLFGTGGAASIEEYTQNVGKSVDEIRGEYEILSKAQELAMQNANNAYKTAGLSANEYMETVTSFAASLKQSTANEVEAATAADQALIDMADNVNKMGTSMESIQNAYQGFAKGNYTMLDNLKLGYGGTKTEMERLLKDAEKLSGQKYDISNLADVYEAIHVVKEELGITGTTAKEATGTISGSLSMAKASWTNLLTGMADENADFDKLVDDFVESCVAVMENILPRAEIALGGIGNLIEQLMPVIVKRIPQIINDVLPQLLQSGLDMISAILQGIQQNLPLILSSGSEIIGILIKSILQMLPMVAETAYTLVMELANGFISNIDNVISSGSEMLLGFVEGIVDKLPELIDTAVNLVVETAMALTDPNTLTNIIEAGIKLITTLAWALVDAIPKLLNAVPTIIGRLVATLIANAPRLLTAAIELLLALGSSMLDQVWQLLTFIPKVAASIIDAFCEIDWANIGQNIIDGIWAGLSAGWNWLIGRAKKLASGLFGAFKGELQINSPSKKFKWLAEMCVAGWDEGAEGLMETDSMTKNVEASFSTMQMKANGTKAYGGAGKGGFQQTVNIYQPVSTPDEMARAMRLEAKYGLIIGVA